MLRPVEIEKEILHGHIFCGIGGGAIGFNKGSARVGNVRAKFTCVGGIDVDAAACRDFKRHVGADATCLDLFSREQYEAFHGKAPPADWKEATPWDVVKAFGGRRPNIVFLSAPCKGFSGLLSEKASASQKYQALNGLTLRGVRLLLEAFKDDPVELIIFENVPRIMTRGRPLLDQITEMYEAFDYAFAETTHDCGELGDLAQSRKRFLLVARHKRKVPPFLYEPDKHRLRGVGEVLDRLPMPLSGLGGPMHRMPSLHWKTWVRLAFVRAGGDWRSLNELAVDNGFLRDYGIIPGEMMRRGPYGVTPWGEPAGCVTANGRPGSGSFSVADPRAGELASAERSNYGVGEWEQPAATVTSARSPGQGRGAVADPRRQEDRAAFGQYGVKSWDQPSQTVIGKAAVGAGGFAVGDPRPGTVRFNMAFRVVKWAETSPAVTGPGGAVAAVADPRGGYGGSTRKNVMRVTGYEEHAGTVTSGHSPSNGGGAVADPRPPQDGTYAKTKYRVTPYDEPSRTVIGASTTGDGAFAVADPHVNGRARSTQLGVKHWDEPTGVVAGESMPTNGAYSVADPRPTHGPNAHTSKHRVTSYEEPSGVVTGTDRVGSGALCVADPRCAGYHPDAHRNKLKVIAYDQPAGTVTGGKHVQSGAASVADRRAKDRLGVLRYDEPAKAVTGWGQHDNGYNSVADPRPDIEDAEPMTLPKPSDRLVCVILALDGTWHRPFTTLELAALQGLVDPEEQFELEGLSDAAWRERIGNCVPPPSATAIASVMGETLLLAWSGQTFTLSSSPIWVRNIAVALSHQPQEFEQ
jgi:site-specific DNA-cytosine methylase